MQDRAYGAITVHQDGHVATITLNNPDRKNALSPRMVNELLYALDDARDEASVRVVVLTGAGESFCAGGDLKQMAGDGPELERRGDFDDLLLRFTQLGKPVVAAVRGYAMGGGVGLVAAADFAIAADDATLGTPEIKRGLFPMMIMAPLQRVVPRRALMNMMLLGDKLSAREALDLGILSHVVPAAELEDKVAEVSAKLAAQSPTAMRMGLAAFHHQADLPIREAVPYLRDQLHALLGTEDAKEGLMAFFQKRAPVWKGR
ncbi:MAG: enoyl-CoA hydratase-related protein [Polyangiales bacterium]|nr:enoyl-CoA hydratase/isomerase family protein [Myxococcales bacterium]MCB9657183.1 enoyl-CoA hydratase/isomerase family protein [Sandaracinaceae bacterium]